MLNDTPIRFDRLDLAGMQRLADALIARLPKRSVIGLVGTLGAGKTSLTQAIARAAGIDAADVTSPTFTLLQTHQGTLTLNHLDAYRVADEDEFLELGVAELFEQPGWTIVEWADRVEAVMPPETLWLKIEIAGDDLRTVTATGGTGELSEAIAGLQADMNSADRDTAP